MTRPLLLAVCLALAMTQPISSQAPQPPKFTGGTELVRVDFIVTDKAGRLVPGIRETDCVVKEDGKERRIVSFEAFGGAAATAAVADPYAAGVSSSPARAVKASTVLLRGDLEMRARVAQRFVRLNPTMTPHQAAQVAIERSGDVNHTARTRREAIYATAMQALTWLSDKPGRHSVVIVSGGWAKDQSDPAYNSLVTRSLRVNAPMHFVDARGLPGGSSFKDVQYGAALNRNSDEGPTGRADAAEGTVNLADDSGGLIVENTNDFEKGLTRVLDTMQIYYVIGYEAPPHGKPGFHKIQVEVKTKGVSVRARRGYFDAPPSR